MQADVVLEELRVVCLEPQESGEECHTGRGHTFSNKATSTPTRTYLLIVPFPIGQAFKHMGLWVHSYSNQHRDKVFKYMSLWGPFLFKPPQAS